MNRTVKAIMGVIFVLVIMFSAIAICQNIGSGFKLDVTDQKIYTLSDGTKSILKKIGQPIKVKLYYAETAAMKASDQIRYFNNYYQFVKALLEEYESQSNGKVQLQIIDPRPFSEEESQAIRFGLQRFPISKEENFFFGLAIQTQFGVEKSIPFFSPDRHNFVEYDISYLIDTAITRQKSKIGVLSSLPVMGEEDDYMAQIRRMQGMAPVPPWTIIQQLRQQYEVVKIDADTEDINDIDMLMVIHPQKLPDKTLFAIDQFVLGGGPTIVMVDPHSQIQWNQQYGKRDAGNPIDSEMNVLLNKWGLDMPAETFAGDRSLCLEAKMPVVDMPAPVIGFLGLSREAGCFNKQSLITGSLNQVRLLMSGVLNEVDPNDGVEISRTPLLMTTNRGNSWTPQLPVDLMMMHPGRLMDLFQDGEEPVKMGYFVTGKFKSAFPEGVEFEVDTGEDKAKEGTPEKPKEIRKLTGLTQADKDCAVVVFADSDFISDIAAYGNSGFGMLMVIGDNVALLLNTIDRLSGSSDLISIRSRGNYRRPFTVVDKIERKAEEETRQEEELLNAKIKSLQDELTGIVAQLQQGQEDIIGSAILEKQKQVDTEIELAKNEMKQVRKKRRQSIDDLGSFLQNINMLAVPAVILLISIVVGIYRSARKRHYISHASDS